MLDDMVYDFFQIDPGICLRNDLVISRDEADRLDHDIDEEWLESFSGLIKVRKDVNLPDNWEMMLMDQAHFWERYPE